MGPEDPSGCPVDQHTAAVPGEPRKRSSHEDLGPTSIDPINIPSSSGQPHSEQWPPSDPKLPTELEPSSDSKPSLEPGPSSDSNPLSEPEPSPRPTQRGTHHDFVTSLRDKMPTAPTGEEALLILQGEFTRLKAERKRLVARELHVGTNTNGNGDNIVDPLDVDAFMTILETFGEQFPDFEVPAVSIINDEFITYFAPRPESNSAVNGPRKNSQGNSKPEPSEEEEEEEDISGFLLAPGSSNESDGTEDEDEEDSGLESIEGLSIDCESCEEGLTVRSLGMFSPKRGEDMVR